MNTIYTIGYAGAKPADILAHVERLNATLVDIRYSSYSRTPQWQGRAICELIEPGRYVHLQSLGNINYKNGGPIRLLNPSENILQIRQLLERGPIILLCVCKDWQNCHRLTAATYLHEALGAPVEHLSARDWKWFPES